MMKKNSHATSILFCGLLCVLILSGCSHNTQSQAPVDAEPQKVTVLTEQVKATTMYTYLDLNGGIEAKNSVTVYPNIAGKIAGNAVVLGSYVRKGDPLVYVDPSLPGSRYELSPITASISGCVISIPPKPGMKVSTDSAVVTIGDLSQLEIKTYVPEKYFSQLQEGLQAHIKVESYPDTYFEGRVKSVSPVVDESSRTVEVVIVLKEKDSRITAGMYAKIKLYLKEYKAAISVPEKAVVHRNGTNMIFTVTDGKAVAKPVELGVLIDARYQILSGLSEGETLIIDGLTAIQDGSEVQVVTSNSEDNE
ncbi:MAG: efflux RND transporter periplasmic adaptor subunit [Treponema sp.]|nr:efflux RND transporter periplasmic adaptor subunit [Treponema sp.]